MKMKNNQNIIKLKIKFYKKTQKHYQNKIINYERKFLQEYKKVNANKVK